MTPAPKDRAMKTLGLIAGWILVILGVPLFWSPIPVGAVMIAVGAALIIASSEPARIWLRRRREKMRRLDAALGRIEERAPARLRRSLETTDGPNAHRGRAKSGEPADHKGEN